LWYTLGNNSKTGLDEKRTLADFPTGITNAYFSSIGTWYSDHTPYRNTLISFENKVSQYYETFYRTKINTLLSDIFIPSWYSSSEYQSEFGDGSAYLVPLVKDAAIYGRSDWLFYTGDNSIGYYQGTNILSEEDMAAWNSTYMQLNDACNKRGIKLVVMIAPNKEQVYSEYMPSYRIKTSEKREMVMNAYMQNNSNVTFLYPLNALLDAKSLYDTYYMQDTHWNNVGAYVGATVIYKALGMPVIPLEDVKVTETTKTGGDLSNFCGYSSTYTDYSLGYHPEINVNTKAIDGTSIEIFTSDSKNSRKAIVISDSFRTAIKQYLAKDFSTTTVTHRNDMNNPIIQESLGKLNEGDVVLLLAVERYDSPNLSAAKELIPMLQR
jgi:hypothetical protein